MAGGGASSLSSSEVQIARVDSPDIDLLEEFLYQAVFVPDGYGALPRSVVDNPGVRVYIDEFGQPGDILFTASLDGKTVGAAWSRILAHPGKIGYGNIDEVTPELAVSVLPEHRNCGIGTLLLNALHAELATKGYAQISLSVQKENPAHRLYRSLGYDVVGENVEDWIMAKRLKPESPCRP